MFETSLRTMLQRKSRSVLAAFLILAVLVLFSGVLAVRKKIDFDKLDKEWKDEEEDEDWHEDSYEWKRKMQEKKQPAFDMSNIQNMKPEELMAMQGGGMGGGGGGGMSMTFAQLKDGICTSRKCTNELAVKWADLMGTGGIQAKPYAVEDDQICLFLVFFAFCFSVKSLKELRGFPPCNFCCFIILDNLMDRART